MKNRRNYYRILHVQPDAPTEVIRSSYRTMMQRLRMHPDLGGDHQNAALVNEAYAVLMNPTARAEYDASLASNRNAKQGKSAMTINQTENKEHCPFCYRQHSLGKAIEPESVCTDCWSPLFPAEKQTFKRCGQRTIQRIGKQWPVAIYTRWPQSSPHTGQTQDVSLNGIQLLTTKAMSDGQIVKITGKTLDSVARVVNHQEIPNADTMQWRIGLEFITLCFHQTHGTFVSLDV